MKITAAANEQLGFQHPQLAEWNHISFCQFAGPLAEENGELVGKTVLDSPNSFLCTKKNYGDFILEFDVKLDGDFNSGVQIRSESNKEYSNGRVHGYQLEIEPATNDRDWSGGIYDEARRGWLYNLEKNPKGKKAFKKNEWNHFRVEAIGNSIRTWINGIQCANLVDDMTPEGFIGLQVHGIGNRKEDAGMTIRWRNIRIMTGNPEANRLTPDPDVPEISYLVNKLTPGEKQKGWELLWDGKNTRITNFETANQFVGRKRRDGWEL
jgi:hypothetical protein